MLAVPAPTAVTRPVAAFTVATAVLEEDQVPPAVPLDVYVAVPPIHKGDVPVIVPAEAVAFTVSEAEEETGAPHPLLTV